MIVTTLYVASIALALLAGATGLIAWTVDRPWPGRAARWLSVAAFLAVGVAWVIRWTTSGHIPLFGTWESALSIAFFMLAAGLVWNLLASEPRVGPATTLTAAMILAHGFGYDSTIHALTISERSLVVYVHAFLSWMAFGAFAVNLGVSASMIVRPVTAGIRRSFDLSLSIGFVLFTAMIATGSIYKFMLFGKPWSFDPIETMAMIAWLGYGTLLHMNLLSGWKSRRIARWTIGAFVVLLLSYRAIIYFPSWSTYHIFDMNLRTHIVGPEETE